jgi:hypothetical protein
LNRIAHPPPLVQGERVAFAHRPPADRDVLWVVRGIGGILVHLRRVFSFAEKVLER